MNVSGRAGGLLSSPPTARNLARRAVREPNRLLRRAATRSFKSIQTSERRVWGAGSVGRAVLVMALIAAVSRARYRLATVVTQPRGNARAGQANKNFPAILRPVRVAAQIKEIYLSRIGEILVSGNALIRCADSKVPKR